MGIGGYEIVVILLGAQALLLVLTGLCVLLRHVVRRTAAAEARDARGVDEVRTTASLR